ncbi:hypothetical protein H9P43_000497 [Blastocladiella emersonii ATCC 22665]|nr:hypothetical protein H9P43_000497 [Blastocladiella emersonii ATCC 22665]
MDSDDARHRAHDGDAPPPPAPVTVSVDDADAPAAGGGADHTASQASIASSSHSRDTGTDSTVSSMASVAVPINAPNITISEDVPPPPSRLPAIAIQEDDDGQSNFGSAEIHAAPAPAASSSTAASGAPASPTINVTATDRTIIGLQKELKKTWKLLEEANSREAQNKDQIVELQSKLAAQTRSLGGAGAGGKRGPGGAGAADSASVLEIVQQRDALAREVEARTSREAQLRNELEHMQAHESEQARERATLLGELASLKELVALKQEEGEKEANARDRLERELRDARAAADARATDLKARGELLAKAGEDLKRFEAQLRETRDARDKLATETEQLAALKAKLEEEANHQLFATNSLLAENTKLAQEVKLADDDADRMQSEMKTLAKMREMMQRKLKQVDEGKAEAEQERDALKSLVYSLERQVESHKKQAENDRKQIEDLVRERDILSKNYLKATSATQKQTNLVKLHEQTKQNLEQEISGYKEEAAKQRKLILALEKERDRYVNEVAQIQQHKQAAEEEVIIKENQIFDYKKKISEAEYKLKQQQALYEQVRSDRNLYSKNLIESQDEITEMRRKLKIMTHQIEQYKEEISAKESALLKEHFEHQKVDKEKDAAKQEVQKLKQQLDAAHQFIQNQQAEENKLRHIISEADTERMRQKKEYEAVIQERDILGTQLIRRNDELALLYEKIKIQQSTLNKGEIQYRERLEDIRVLKLEVKKLRREKTILQHETTNVEALRNEIYRLQKEMLNERTRVKVLEEELENPMNMHRWRKLAGSDPSTFELVQKVQTLQRRLIAKTEQVVEKELLLQAKEKLYLDLKAMLSRVPGPEVVQQLETLKNLVKEKTRESKALASELNMLQSQALDYRNEVAELTRQCQEFKKKYLTLKKVLQQKKFKAVAIEGGAPRPKPLTVLQELQQHLNPAGNEGAPTPAPSSDASVPKQHHQQVGGMVSSGTPPPQAHGGLPPLPGAGGSVTAPVPV